MSLPACPACDAPAPRWLTKDGYPLHRCGACGLAFVFPAPSVEQLAAEVYSVDAGYHASRAADAGSVAPNPLDDALLARVAELTSGRRLLDVGCSAGELLARARAAGFAPVGVELNDGAAAAARAAGLDVRTGTLEQVGFEEGEFDAVVLGDLIEHVPDMPSLVAECRRVLARGGVLAVRTPNLRGAWPRVSLALRWLGVPPSAVTPPEHLSQLTPRALDALLARAGFERAARWFEPPPPLRYELAMTRLPRRLRRSRSPLVALRLALAVGAYGLAYPLTRLLRPVVGADDAALVALYR